mmetsp:Transcript_16220/g.35227  ORF Transcript_16220/g.35227 Transcript_16220/m.35227 type:complete len:603 (-) Transcript_16220:102-1910(-)
MSDSMTQELLTSWNARKKRATNKIKTTNSKQQTTNNNKEKVRQKKYNTPILENKNKRRSTMKIISLAIVAAATQIVTGEEFSEEELQWREDLGRELLEDHRELFGEELLEKYIKPVLMKAYELKGAWDHVVEKEAEFYLNLTQESYCNVLGGTVMPYVGAPLAVAGAQSVLRKKAPFPTLDLAKESGVFDLNENMVNNDGTPNFIPKDKVAQKRQDKGSIFIGVAADWGAGTIEAAGFTHHMNSLKPDYTLHLGDIYLAGRPEEIKEKVFTSSPCKSGDRPTTSFPNGTKGTFFFNGNHEMISRGYGYFETLLKGYNQPTSYGGFMSEYWFLPALDSSYDCLPEVTGIRSAMQYAKHIAGNPKVELNKAQKDWLTDPELNFFDPKNGRGIMMMQHQQLFSAFLDKDYGLTEGMPTEEFLEQSVGTTTKFFQKQLKKGGYPANYGIGAVFGHDHKAAAYVSNISASSEDELPITMASQLVGNGGFEVSSPDAKPYYAEELGLQWYDSAVYESVKQPLNRPPIKVGYNGWYTMNITGRDLTMKYYRSTPWEETAWKHVATRTLRVMEDGQGVKQTYSWVSPKIQTKFEPTPFVNKSKGWFGLRR